MEDLRKYTQKSELYKLSAEEKAEKMQLVMKEVEKISAYTALKSCPMNLLQPAIWITYISRKKIISFDKQKSTKTRMFSCFFNTHEF